MTTPGFAADASVYRTGNSYRMAVVASQISSSVYLADYVDWECFGNCQTTSCSGKHGADLGSCLKSASNSCMKDCTRPGSPPQTPTTPPPNCTPPLKLCETQWLCFPIGCFPLTFCKCEQLCCTGLDLGTCSVQEVDCPA